MERVGAAVAGVGVTVALFGGMVALRIVSRFLRAVTWFLETVALLSFGLLFGYVAYRVLWGGSDDPRIH